MFAAVSQHRDASATGGAAPTHSSPWSQRGEVGEVFPESVPAGLSPGQRDPSSRALLLARVLVGIPQRQLDL